MAIRLYFDLGTDATPAQIASLIKLTEGDCVVDQTLRQGPEIAVTYGQ